ncbi:hypothetical protein BXQ17_02995 [Polaribacter sp. BM10]|uniref:hypothetical protein n=1 Tax=Polaribacter sp. BM10 TaxID=1529069 RepID=UPI00098A7329|nr:hypothetical protein [Polaribacter sp. BM10]AQS93105.1 hypothetical protein BXQ17_02995 [Polaribacter sp. BM10]
MNCKFLFKYALILGALFLLYNCNKSSDLKQNLSCNEIYFKNLKEISDAKNNFKISLPNNWKTSNFIDDYQSSIYTADTTKQLTKSLLLDVNFINNAIEIDDIFKLKIEHENLTNKLIQKEQKEITFLNRKSYYVVSIGKKQNFKYKSLQVFVPLNKTSSLAIKAEVYGDSLVQKRICKVLTLIDKIKIEQ